MKRIFIFVLLIILAICHSINALASDADLIKSYKDLFQILSKKIVIDDRGLNEFDALIKRYLDQGRSDFGRVFLSYSSNIAMVNGSLIVGHTLGEGKTKISLSDINIIKSMYEDLYLPLYSLAVPTPMISKYPQYVLDHNIIPTYMKLVDFKDVRDQFYKILYVSKIPAKGQFFMTQAITGLASGIALASKRRALAKKDLEIAKMSSCTSWPRCSVMLAEELFQFDRDYKGKIKKIY